MSEFRRVLDEPLLTTDAMAWEAKYPSIMFPCVIEVPPWLDNPVDRLYMYYASHTGHGIGLATAAKPGGPWQARRDPVLELHNATMIGGHISSPHVMVDDAEERFYLYFHGSARGVKGQRAGCAVSRDGLNFEIDHKDVLLECDADNPAAWDRFAAVYMRPFWLNEQLFALYMGGNGEGKPGISNNRQGLARGRDYTHWERARKLPLIAPHEDEGEYGIVRHSGVQVCDGHLQVYYSTRTSPALDREVIRSARVETDRSPEQWQAVDRRTVLQPELKWEGDDLRDPFPFEFEGALYLFYVGGTEAGIGLAIEHD